MSKRESRVVRKEEAIAFIQNMRWFAGHGTIRTKPYPNKPGYVTVTANKAAFSNFIFSK